MSKPKKSEIKIATTQTEAAALTGIPVEQIKFMKTLGCRAFRPGSRIHLGELMTYAATDEFQTAWQERHLPKTEAELWELRLKRAKALRCEEQLRKEKARLWDAEQAKMLFAAGDSAMMAVLRRRLEEQANLIAGKSATAILKINRPFHDDLLNEMRAARVAAIEKAGADMPDDD